MNSLNTIIKYNWKPAVLGISFIANLNMNYYKNNVDGITGDCPIVEMCDGNNHILSSSKYRQYGGETYLFESIVPTLILGALSVPITSYYVYKNHKNNKLNEDDKKREGCLCGELK